MTSTLCLALSPNSIQACVLVHGHEGLHDWERNERRHLQAAAHEMLACDKCGRGPDARDVRACAARLRAEGFESAAEVLDAAAEAILFHDHFAGREGS